MKNRILNILIIINLLLSLSALMTSRVIAASGSIWTTDASCGGTKNENHYHTGETVFISGAQFGNNEQLNWTIKKIGGGTVASGTVVAKEVPTEPQKKGQFCVPAYTIRPEDTGIFKVDVMGNNDNFQANPGEVNPTSTPVTPTVETSPVPTTETPEPQPTIPPTETQEQPTETPPTETQEQPTETPPTETQEQPTETPPTETQEQPTETPPTETQEQPSETPVAETPQPQVTPLPTENPSQTATSVPVQTETSSPTQASTNAATQSPQEAPVTGSLADPAILQGASALFGLVSLGSYALLKRKSD